MHLTFHAEGPGGTPTLLLGRITPASARLLRDTVEPLMAGISRRMPFHEIAALDNPAGFRLAGVPGTTSTIRQLDGGAFDWEETLSGWLRVYDLLEPFAAGAGGTTPRRLNAEGSVAVIASTASEP